MVKGFNIFYLNLSCEYSFFLNFTCLQLAVCLSMFLLIILLYKHIMMNCTAQTQYQTRYPDPAGVITGYSGPLPG